MDKSLIPEYIAALPEATDSQLEWLYKVCLSNDKDKAAFKALSDKVQKERKKRGKLVTISSKVIEPKIRTSNVNPDDYEGVPVEETT